MARKPSPSESPKASAKGKSVRKTVGEGANAVKPLHEAQSQPEKRPVGRPTSYDPSFCEQVVELGKAGMSRIEIASNLGFARQTLYDWEVAHAEFLDAMTRAKQEEQSWWEQQARLGLFSQPGGPSINAALWAKNMAARFRDDYTDRSESDNTININVRRFKD